MQGSVPVYPIEQAAAFDCFGSVSTNALNGAPHSPVIISVPHAGCLYPPRLLAQARVALPVLRRLEDRHADLLALGAVEAGHSVIMARAPRALIDLNRDPREIDPAMVRNLPHGQPLIASAKLRGGLGLIPRRLQGANELWHGPLYWTDICQRIAQIHEPYHAAVEALMARARDAHGYAILIDLHSMPPLAHSVDGPTAQIVLGDRFGRSASGRLLARAAALFNRHGLTAALNHPYPGNYLLERHGRPDRGFHALQIEIDRTLYLDAAMEHPANGVSNMQAMLVDLAEALAQEWPSASFAQAAE